MPWVIFIEERRIEVLVVEADEEISCFKYRPEAGQFFLEEGIVPVSLVIINSNDGNIQICRVIAADILENVPSFNIEYYFAHDTK
jgi:hypothetical protein